MYRFPLKNSSSLNSVPDSVGRDVFFLLILICAIMFIGDVVRGEIL